MISLRNHNLIITRDKINIWIKMKRFNHLFSLISMINKEVKSYIQEMKFFYGSRGTMCAYIMWQLISTR